LYSEPGARQQPRFQTEANRCPAVLETDLDDEEEYENEYEGECDHDADDEARVAAGRATANNQ
jgi:hypothetical protein